MRVYDAFDPRIIIGLGRLYPSTLDYDLLDDPIGVTKGRGELDPPPAVHAYGHFYREWVELSHPRRQYK